MVGVKRISFLMPENASLKDKRQIIRKLRDTLKARFNISFAEVDEDEKLQRSAIAVTMVSSNEELIRTAFTQISNLIESLAEVRVFNEVNDVFRYENETETIHLS
jgi:uncharacterized protein YlxP (DUF503 family)